MQSDSSTSRKRLHREQEAFTGQQRIRGPTLPPSQNQQREVDAEKTNDDSNSSSDDDIGPKLSPFNTKRPHDRVPDHVEAECRGLSDPHDLPSTSLHRDEWMISPPDKGISKSTRLRNRRFNAGRESYTSHMSGDTSSWIETPEQKKRRLENELMGVQMPASEDRRLPIDETLRSNISTAKKGKAT
jgi:Protein of unknown function (DUF3752)